MKYTFTRKLSLKFLVSTSVTIVVIFALMFGWVYRVQEQHIMEQVRKQAIILHKQIVLTRQWVADHQCVLIPKTKEVSSSPFLPEPDLLGQDGRWYTRISPSVMTKMLSDRATLSELYSFRLTNTAWLNPDNSADDFEAEALSLFRSSRREGIFRIEERRGKTVLRYVAPVYISENCVQCHMTQGYKPGDVGGCLSVLIPMDQAKQAITRNGLILLGGGVTVAGSLILFLFLGARSMVFKPIGEIRSAMSRLTAQGMTDGTAEQGDELKEIADSCYVLDERMKNQHQELERKIAEATRDLSGANKSLEAANRDLVRLNQTKSDFFSDVSHELRTPLTAIKGAVDLMERKYPQGDPAYLNIIRRNADHLLKTVLDFLDYSRIESGQLDMHLEKGSLNAAAEDAILSQIPGAQARSLHLILQAPEEVVSKFDRKRIHQILTNLISNAVRFSPEGGTVEVGVKRADADWAEVCVSDEGPGIDKKYHSAIFERFYQIADDRNQALHKGSSGIGLAICKGLVEAHGGRIWIENAPAAGSSFHFTVPIHE